METEPQYDDDNESVWGTIIGWGILGIFAIGFAWYVGAPLLMGEKWADKKDDAIAVVRNSRPEGAQQSLYDLIRAYSLAQADKSRTDPNVIHIGEFSWDALQREGPNYEVTLLWTEGSSKKVAVWRVNLEDQSQKPQGNEASTLIKQVLAAPKS